MAVRPCVPGLSLSRGGERGAAGVAAPGAVARPNACRCRGAGDLIARPLAVSQEQALSTSLPTTRRAQTVPRNGDIVWPPGSRAAFVLPALELRSGNPDDGRFVRGVSQWMYWCGREGIR